MSSAARRYRPCGGAAGRASLLALCALLAGAIAFGDEAWAATPDKPADEDKASGQEDGKTSRSDGAKPAPKKADGAKPVPEKADGTKPVPEKADGTKPVPEKADGTKPVPEKTDGAEPAPKEGSGKPITSNDDEDDDDDDDAFFQDEPDAKSDGDTNTKGQGDTKASDGLSEEEAVFTDEGGTPGILPNELIPDRLAIGGQLYMRLAGTVVDQGSAAEQSLAMPNLLDLYLDARPVDRLRAYARARLAYDPTVTADSTDLLGNARDPLSVVLDQLWLKTDIARTVYITLGKQRIKWGESRIWNPTDFLNNTRRDPLAFFDERTGVNLLKLHFPIESLDWNIYLIGILDGVNQWDRAGGAARIEMLLGPMEWSLSFAAGNNMTTAFGVGVSAPIWDFDFTAELSITNESGRVRYLTPFDSTVTPWVMQLEGNAEDIACVVAATTDESGDPLTEPDVREVLGCVNAPTETLDGWYPRVSAGLTYALRYNDDDLMFFGLEYFYNSTGYGNKDLYPWALVTGDFEPFYLAEHYAGFVWSVPAPGNWDDISFTTSTIANLSDFSFVQRLDVSAVFFTRLRLEVYAQFHFGQPGGELRFEYELPQALQDAGLPSDRIPHPIFNWGINLRLAI